MRTGIKNWRRQRLGTDTAQTTASPLFRDRLPLEPQLVPTPTHDWVACMYGAWLLRWQGVRNIPG